MQQNLPSGRANFVDISEEFEVMGHSFMYLSLRQALEKMLFGHLNTFLFVDLLGYL